MSCCSSCSTPETCKHSGCQMTRREQAERQLPKMGAVQSLTITRPTRKTVVPVLKK